MSDVPLYDGFCSTLRATTDALWTSILAHPFVEGLGDGSLTRRRFATWLAQDYGYLQDYARAMALGASAADDVEGLLFYAEQLNVTLTQEMALHRRTCAEFGLEESDLLATPPDEVPRAYGRHLIDRGRSGHEADLVAALLPCAVGYVEIACALTGRGLPGVPAYRDWVETYTSEGMRTLADWLVKRLNLAAEDATAEARDGWLAAYRTSTEFELQFFQMAWDERGAPPAARQA